MSTLASVDDRLPGVTTSSRIRIGSKVIKMGLGFILTVKGQITALNARHIQRTRAWRLDAPSKGQALNLNQLAPTDLLYRAKL